MRNVCLFLKSCIVIPQVALGLMDSFRHRSLTLVEYDKTVLYPNLFLNSSLRMSYGTFCWVCWTVELNSSNGTGVLIWSMPMTSSCAPAMHNQPNMRWAAWWLRYLSTVTLKWSLPLQDWQEPVAPFTLCDGYIEIFCSFKCLGNLIATDGGIGEEIK